VIDVTVVQSPIGPLTLAVRESRVCLLYFDGGPERVEPVLARWYPGALLRRNDRGGPAAALLREYFAGRIDAIDAIEVEMQGTPFQRRVWQELRTIPAGRTASYSAIARAVGAGRAVRAVGAANGANPVAVIVPCHRVIGANGTLTGYGGGLDRKRWLLRHEGAPTLF
jgi:methylated-DNA-[protein]-cysteine S-methyltransferase